MHALSLKEETVQTAYGLATGFGLLALRLIERKEPTEVSKTISDLYDACQHFFSTFNPRPHERVCLEPLADALRSVLRPSGLPPEYDDWQDLADQLVIKLSGRAVFVEKTHYDALINRVRERLTAV